MQYPYVVTKFEQICDCIYLDERPHLLVHGIILLCFQWNAIWNHARRNICSIVSNKMKWSYYLPRVLVSTDKHTPGGFVFQWYNTNANSYTHYLSTFVFDPKSKQINEIRRTDNLLLFTCGLSFFSSLEILVNESKGCVSTKEAFTQKCMKPNLNEWYL